MSNFEKIRVSVRIRPLLKSINEHGKIITHVSPDKSEVEICTHRFTFDDVFDLETPQNEVYQKVVSPLVGRCFDGLNVTILTYGQSGSGKTYTMGTTFSEDVRFEERGMIPRAVEQLFKQATIHREQNAFDVLFRVQFVEIYNEEIRDLLTQPDRLGRQRIVQIIEHPKKGIFLQGVVQQTAKNVQDVFDALRSGSLLRSTGSTSMNESSSRSHAIFSIFIDQVQTHHNGDNGQNEIVDKIYAKLNFVDLAGSERLSRTGAKGERMKESIKINSGLLHLGNVISRLGDSSLKSSFVNYRDSKLTRILQDSLGGNSLTAMIACISPSEYDFTETLNTLRYANRAKNIKNRVFINHDNGDELLSEMRKRNHDLKNENCHLINRVKELEHRLKLSHNKMNILTDFYNSVNRQVLEMKNKNKTLNKRTNSKFDKFLDAFSLIQNEYSFSEEKINKESIEELMNKSSFDDDCDDVCSMNNDEDKQAMNFQKELSQHEAHLKKIISMIESKENSIFEAEEKQQKLHNESKICDRNIVELNDEIHHAKHERERLFAKIKFVSRSKKIKNINEYLCELNEKLQNRINSQKQLAISEECLNEQIKKMRIEVMEAKKIKVQLYRRMNMIQQNHFHESKRKKNLSINQTPHRIRQTWARCENRLDSYIKNKLQFEYEEEKLETYLKQRDELQREIDSLKDHSEMIDSKYYQDRMFNLQFIESCIEDCQNILTCLDVDVDWGEWCSTMSSGEVNYVIHKLTRTSIDYALQALRMETDLKEKIEEISTLKDHAQNYKVELDKSFQNHNKSDFSDSKLT